MSSLAQIHVGLFGAFSCKWANGDIVRINSAKQRALIAILATAAKGTHTRAWLQEILWSLSGEEHGRASLRRALSDLRKRFGDRFDTLFVVTNFDICLKPEFVSLIGNQKDDFSRAANRFEQAVQIDPNHSLAWLMYSRMHSFNGNGPEAVRLSARACRLSPLDPHNYFYDIMAAFAHMVNEDFAAATTLAMRSIAANPRHTSSYRVLAITQHFMGKTDEAKTTVRKLMTLEPDLNIKRYLQSHPASNQATGQAWASALQAAGVPPN